MRVGFGVPLSILLCVFILGCAVEETPVKVIEPNITEKASEEIVRGEFYQYAVRDGDRYEVIVVFYEDIPYGDALSLSREYGEVVNTNFDFHHLTVIVPQDRVIPLVKEQIVRRVETISPPPSNEVPDQSHGRNFIAANNAFAFDLYSQYSAQEGNLFFSPYSIVTALTMTYEGAKGTTADQMRETLGIGDDDDLWRRTAGQLHSLLNVEGKPYQLSTANALWGQEGFPFRQDYDERIETYYGGTATNLDFKEDTELARNTINDWVEEKTNDKIQDLIPRGAVKEDTRLVLTNAIYFKGAWVQQFNENLTEDTPFEIDATTQVMVPMMQRTDYEARFPYFEDENLQILELPYDGDDVSMLILLPRGDLTGIQGRLTPAQLEAWRAELEEQRVNVYIPRFKLETKQFMKETLSDMGMSIAFSNEADFTGMEDASDENLKIDEVIHQAFVEVNEEGTEAAAATAVLMITATGGTPGPSTPVFAANHPFLFVIQHKGTGAILFMGRVTDPRP